MGDKHDECSNPETCLCADNNHGKNKPKFGEKGNDPLGDSLDWIFSSHKKSMELKKKDPDEYERQLKIYKERAEKIQKQKALYEKEPMEYEISQENNNKLFNLLENQIEGAKESIVLELIKLLIISQHTVSTIEIKKIVGRWCQRFNVVVDIDTSLKIVLSDSEVFTSIKQICFDLGQRKKKIVFGNDQLIELSWYLMGRYQIKRIELTGNMLFFNDEYYENNAEQLIRRKARESLIKSKNGGINEIVKMIEDSCKLITWRDIEESIHLKCLLNGIYDIKQGKFYEKFNPNYIILNQIPHNYKPNSKFDKINNVVSQIISNKIDRQSYYDSLSTALHPYTGIDFQFGGIGRPGTGKSQICFLSGMVLGEDNVTDASIHQIASDLTTQKDVAFKFLNIDQDMSDETIRNMDILKRWITQDRFTARGIYEHNTTFRPMARLCFMANSLYEIANSDDAEALYERTHIIKIENKFRGSEDQTKDIFKKIATKSELDGFITYLLENATDIWKDQKIHYPINIQTVRDTWNLHGNRIKEFSEIYLEKGVSYRTDQVEVWNKWLSFAIRKEYPAKDKKKFHTIFDEIIGNSPSKTSIEKDGERIQIYAYSGFRLLTDEELADRQMVQFDSDENSTRSKSYKKAILELLNITKTSPNYSIFLSKIDNLLEFYESTKNK